MDRHIDLPTPDPLLIIGMTLLTQFRDANGARWCSDDLVGKARRRLGHVVANTGDRDAAMQAVEQSRVLFKKLCDDCPHVCRMKKW